MIHLDTNAAIALLNDHSVSARAKFDAARLSDARISMSMIVYHELMYGAAHSERRTANEEKISVFVTAGRIALLPFDEGDAAQAADIRAHLRRIARSVGPFDVLIAGQARCRGATLVTANTREFERVPGLSVVDWAG